MVISVLGRRSRQITRAYQPVDLAHCGLVSKREPGSGLMVPGFEFSLSQVSQNKQQANENNSNNKTQQ